MTTVKDGDTRIKDLEQRLSILDDYRLQGTR